MRITDNLAIARTGFVTLIQSTPTANRTLTLPDKNGIIAVLGDVPLAQPRPYVEVLVVGAVNTLPNLTNTPTAIANYPFSLTINGERRYSIGQAVFARSGVSLTWNAIAAGYSLPVGSDVIAEYWI